MTTDAPAANLGSIPPHAQTVVGVFNDRSAAESAVTELEDAGFDHDDIGFMARGTDSSQIENPAVPQVDDAAGTAEGILSGGIIGGVLATAIAVLIPPVGPVVVAGLLASLCGGTLAGMAVGGIVGALGGLGIPEERAEMYDKEFRTGKAIVAVKTSRVAEAIQILTRHDGYLIHSESGIVDSDNRVFPPAHPPI